MSQGGRLPVLRDNVQELVDQLRVLNQTLAQGGLSGDSGEDGTINVFDGASARAGGAINPYGYRIYETADLAEANGSGTITLEPGEEATIVESDNASNGLLGLAIGASDKPDVRYRLYVDGERTVGGLTNSPLGTVNSPFSFVKMLGGVLPAERRIEYRAIYDPAATGEVELAARLHVEEL
jgi:hypothetical protein